MNNKNNIKKSSMSEIRKDFLKRLLYLFLGIIPILILANEKSSLRYIAAIGIIISLWQLLMIIASSEMIIDDFFSPKIEFEKTVKPFDKFMFYFSNYFFGGSLIFMLFEIRKIDNTILGTQLFWKSGFIGILIALMVTLIIKRTNPSVYHLSSRRYVVYFGLFIGFFLFTASFASFINHFFCDKTITCKNYEIKRKAKGGKRNQESWLFLKIENNIEERFDVTESIYDQTNEGGKIQLCTKKGKLGYEFVTEFKVTDKW